MYYVNVTHSQITIHEGVCRADASGRHGPFKSKYEAVSAARALAIRDIADCSHCGGAGGRYVGCHCRECRGQP